MIRYFARHRRSTAWMATIPLCLLLPAGCQNKPAPPPPSVPEVDVAHPVVRTSVEWDEYTGRLGAIETVDVRARVDGFLESIHFKAGQIVKKGDLLFTIDLRPYIAELERTNANIRQAQAELEHAKFDLKRIEGFKRENIAADKEYKDVVFEEQKAQAALDLAQAAHKIAALNVEWSKVVAPITGRISREFVTVGNLIRSGSTEGTLLTTIVSLDPIYCYFDADEQAYLKYARMSRSGERVSSRDKANPVHVALFDETDFKHEGRMDFVDNAFDQSTGTMRARAILPNADHFLVPGLFVRVRLLGSGLRPMVFIPDAAIATDQTSRLVFTVDDKNVIHQHPVITGRLQNGLRRIKSGLDGSETIVVSGVQRVRANAIVKPNRVSIDTSAWSPESNITTQPASSTASQPEAEFGGQP